MTALSAEQRAPVVPPRPAPRFSGRSRYSMFVGLMKVLLPAMAAALILLVVAWPQLALDEPRFGLGTAQLTLNQAQNLSMLNPRFDGIDEKGRPYMLTADTATQAQGESDLIELELPKGDITMENGAWLALSARSGDYHRDRRELDLEDEVSLFHDKGFEIRTDAAHVDLAEGTASGDSPVSGHGAAGTIDAEGFRITDRGERVVFTGKSRLVLHPEAKEAMR